MALPWGQIISIGAGLLGASGGGGSKQTSSTTVDPAQMAMYQDLYGRAKGIAQQPFVPYTGSRVAGFNPDQLRQFEATRGMFETGQQYDPMAGLQGLANAPTPTISPVTGFQGSQIQGIQGPSAATIQSTPTFGGATIGQVQGPQAAQIGNVQAPQFQSLLSQDIGAYQSPYQQQVIDQTMADIQRQADIQRGFSQDRAIGAGAFGGSRSALLEGESQRPFIEQMARTSAGLRQAGFENSQQAAQSDLARQQQLGVFSAGQEQQRALEQARLGQQVGLAGYEGDLQRAVEQARLGQQAGLAGQDIAAQRNLQQAQLQQQAGLAGYQGQLSTAQRNAELAQQAGLAGQDIQARMNMMQPELEMRNRQQQQGLLGELGSIQEQRLRQLGQIGLQQQRLQQGALDVPYAEFERALRYGPQQLGLLAQGLSGQPQNTTTTDRTNASAFDRLSGGADIYSTFAGLLT